ncbi:ABC transporter permease [Halorussus salilacus]|uniref:ABC transporter permease n=1 Tax=Halorussus salilacus TaxID=2953750 RepID=UPI00209DDC34|nr:ABC transporter permease [Halorussus salilacus]USZ68735.1 ABC transporter permease [Halorussus salilacus]
MTAVGRVGAEATAAWHSFVRRRTAVFFTFFFPVILVLIFAVLVQTNPGGGGLFAEPPAYYLPGYLAVVVLFTPLSRVGSEVARHREGNRFEKLATTPLSRVEWLLAHTLVNVAIIGIASLIVLGLMALVTGTADLILDPASLALVAAFVALGVAVFCGLGAVLGATADSQDGVIAMSNTIALPLLFLSDTFVTPDLLPAWFRPAMGLSPLSYFARGVRELTYSGGAFGAEMGVLAVLALAFFAAGAYAIPRTD